MPTIEDFYIAENRVHGVSVEDYREINRLVDAVEAFARSTHRCVYIVDLYKHNFLFVSPNIEFWSGKSSEEIKDLGYDFFLDYVPECEQQLLLEINKKGYELFKGIPKEERPDYIFSYGFHIINGDKHRLVNHSITPMAMTKDGHIWLALCTFSLATRKTPGNVVMMKTGTNFYYEYSLVTQEWTIKAIMPMSRMEREILFLSSQGYTMTSIADKLCKSVDTIKSCKRALFSRLKVKNIAEALSLVTNYKFIYSI